MFHLFPHFFSLYFSRRLLCFFTIEIESLIWTFLSNPDSQFFTQSELNNEIFKYLKFPQLIPTSYSNVPISNSFLILILFILLDLLEQFFIFLLYFCHKCSIYKIIFTANAPQDRFEAKYEHFYYRFNDKISIPSLFMCTHKKVK